MNKWRKRLLIGLEQTRIYYNFLSVKSEYNDLFSNKLPEYDIKPKRK